RGQTGHELDVAGSQDPDRQRADQQLRLEAPPVDGVDHDPEPAVITAVIAAVLAAVLDAGDRAIDEDLGPDTERLDQGRVAFEDPEVLSTGLLDTGQRVENRRGVEMPLCLACGVGERAPHVIELLAIETEPLEV